jgi:hypothetical protein
MTADWSAVDAFQKILEVSTFCLTSSLMLMVNVITSLLSQVPHAFQQRLSHEKTPTLCEAIPSFECLTEIWMEMQDDAPHLNEIIQGGLDKIGDYRDRIDSVPAYTLAMRK